MLGDEKYAPPAQLALAARLGIRRLCLHAEGITLSLAGEELRLRCPLPEDFRQAWIALGEYGHALGSQHGA